MHGAFATNTFSQDVMVLHDGGKVLFGGPNSYPRVMVKADVINIQAYFQSRYLITEIARQTIEDAIVSLAQAATYHPVLNWMRTLPQWDRRPRLDHWMVNVYGAENTELTRAIGTKLLIASVRRVRVPGTKYDHMVILEGKQGIMKSTSIRTLYGAEFYTDQMPESLSGKDSSINLNGAWVIEFSEVEHIIRLDPEIVRQFLTRQVDRYRPPYERSPQVFPRQSIFIGTTNDTEYLKDEHGNRRFWPIRCQCQSVDIGYIEANRDQMWAEAVMRDAAGEDIWFSDPALVEAATEEQSKRMMVDPWQEKIAGVISGLSEITAVQVLDRLFVPTERQTQREKRRVSAALRHLGWQPMEVKWDSDRGTSVRMWGKSVH